MGLFSFFGSLLKGLTTNRLPTKRLTWLYVRVRHDLPDLEADTAFMLAAKLHMQPYLDRDRVSLLDMIAAYKVGKEGFCGLWLADMQRHDTELAQDEADKITRWVMQMNYLLLSADLKSAEPKVIADIIIQTKPAIKKDVDAVLKDSQLTTESGRKYDKVIRQFTHSPDYEEDLDKIRYALRQV